MNIRNYLPLYLGCHAYTSKGKGRLVSFDVDTNTAGILIDDNEDDLHEFASEVIQPVLRPLSDLTDDEFKVIFRMFYEHVYDDQPTDGTWELLSDGGGGCGLTYSETIKGKEWKYGLTVEASGFLFSANGNYLTVPPYEAVRFLLSQHIDLYGLIDAGLAIDASEVKEVANES